MAKPEAAAEHRSEATSTERVRISGEAVPLNWHVVIQAQARGTGRFFSCTPAQRRARGLGQSPKVLFLSKMTRRRRAFQGVKFWGFRDIEGKCPQTRIDPQNPYPTLDMGYPS